MVLTWPWQLNMLFGTWMLTAYLACFSSIAQPSLGKGCIATSETGEQMSSETCLNHAASLRQNKMLETQMYHIMVHSVHSLILPIY